MPGDNMRVGGLVTVHKWNPEDLEAKTSLEAELVPVLKTEFLADADWLARQHEKHPDWIDEQIDDAAHRYATVTAHERAIERMKWLGRGPLEEHRSHNSVVNTGLTDYNNGLIGGSLTAYSNANAGIGAGDSSSAVAVGQTDLQALTGATHRYIQALDATYPTVANGVLTFRATFATGNGNFGWQEIVITNNTANLGTTNNLTRILNRFLNAAGTKPATQSWQVTVTMTLA